jgi:hypothetical protein
MEKRIKLSHSACSRILMDPYCFASKEFGDTLRHFDGEKSTGWATAAQKQGSRPEAALAVIAAIKGINNPAFRTRFLQEKASQWRSLDCWLKKSQQWIETGNSPSFHTPCDFNSIKPIGHGICPLAATRDIPQQAWRTLKSNIGRTAPPPRNPATEAVDDIQATLYALAKYSGHLNPEKELELNQTLDPNECVLLLREGPALKIKLPVRKEHGPEINCALMIAVAAKHSKKITESEENHLRKLKAAAVGNANKTTRIILREIDRIFKKIGVDRPKIDKRMEAPLNPKGYFGEDAEAVLTNPYRFWLNHPELKTKGWDPLHWEEEATNTHRFNSDIAGYGLLLFLAWGESAETHGKFRRALAYGLTHEPASERKPWNNAYVWMDIAARMIAKRKKGGFHDPLEWILKGEEPTTNTPPKEVRGDCFLEPRNTDEIQQVLHHLIAPCGIGRDQNKTRNIIETCLESCREFINEGFSTNSYTEITTLSESENWKDRVIAGMETICLMQSDNFGNEKEREQFLDTLETYAKARFHKRNRSKITLRVEAAKLIVKETHLIERIEESEAWLAVMPEGPAKRPEIISGGDWDPILQVGAPIDCYGNEAVVQIIRANNPKSKEEEQVLRLARNCQYLFRTPPGPLEWILSSGKLLPINPCPSTIS